MKTILITGAGNLKNNGIYAMVMSVYQNVQKKRKDVNFYMLSQRKKEDSEILKSTSIKTLDYDWHLKRKNRMIFIVNIIWNMVFLYISNFLNLKSKSETLNAYRRCDLILDLSGDSISTDYGRFSLFFALYSVFLGIVAKKKIIMLAQTMGPFHDRISEKIAKYILNRVGLIVLRENKSKNYLNKINLKKRKELIVTNDVGFLLEPDFVKAKKALKNENVFMAKGNIIGLSPSDIIYHWLTNSSGKINKNSYIVKMAEFIDKLILDYNYELILIPHVFLSYNNDQKICEAIYRNLKYKSKVHLLGSYYNAAILKAIMAETKFLISFRMHAAVGALSMKIPVICWSYNDKFEGIIGNKMKLNDYVIDIRKGDMDKALEKTKQAIIKLEKNYSQIKNMVAKRVKQAEKESMQNINIVLKELT